MIHLDRHARTPLADQIVQQVSQLVQTGHWAAGAKLPSIRQLAQQLNISPYTVVNAYDRLIASGVLESRATSGFYVLARGQVGYRSEEEELGSAGEIDRMWLARRALQAGKGQLAAGSAFVPTSWIDEILSPAFIAKALRQTLAVTTAPPQGLPEFREQLALKLRGMGIPADAGRILVTFGASHAFDLICRTLIQANDKVLVEDPAYHVMFARLNDLGVQSLPVPRTPEGPDLERLDALCREYRPRIFFMQSLLHNPTGWSATPAVLHRVLELANRYDMLIAEDDVYGDLAPNQPVRLAQLSGLQRVIFYSSFTKVINPAWRLGYLAAEPALIELLTTEKMRSVLTGSMIEEVVATELLRSGRYRKHVQVLQNKLALARSQSLRCLTDAGILFQRPAENGVFLWGELPPAVDVDALIRAAYDVGILLAKGRLFFAHERPSQHLRFNVANCHDVRLLEFLQLHLAQYGVTKQELMAQLGQS